MYFDKFKDNISKSYSFDIKYKNQSPFMKFIGALLFFNKSFMTKYTTTIGSTIYFPSEDFIKQNDQGSIEILSHELVHVGQANKYGKLLFSILYLFPQCLAALSILSLLAFFNIGFLWFLVCLVFIAPIPAPWRAAFEIGGYTMSLFVSNLQLTFFQNPPEKIAELLTIEAVRIDNMNFKGPCGHSVLLANWKIR